jgi:hypothetical protein
MADEQIKPPAPLFIPAIAEFRRDVDFVSRYANNVQLESNAFDVKLTFGILDQRDGVKDVNAKPSVDQHTSINLSWPEAKLLVFWMQVHLAAYEKDNGKIKIPATALPAEIPANIHERLTDLKARESVRQGLEIIRKMRVDFIASLKD